MKRNYLLFTSMILVTIGVILTSNASGPASNGNLGTGAPGDGSTNCTTCHNGGTFGTVTIDLQVKDDSGNVITEYAPSTTYDVSINVSNSAGTPSGYGFCTIVLRDANDEALSGFSEAGTGAQISTSGSRQYAEHSSPSSSGSFSFKWTSPSPGTGDVRFYAGANAVNGGGSNEDDNAALAEFMFPEVVGDTNDTNTEWPEGIQDFGLNVKSIMVYPNPVRDFVSIEGVNDNEAADLYNVNGMLIGRYVVTNSSLDFSGLTPGIYFIRSEDKLGKFIKY